MAMDKRGFTLVELLVVIGIIAVLIAILLPTLSGVREQANALKCASNMRQLATALVMYASGNKGRYPTNAYDLDPATAGNQFAFWTDLDRIGRYLPAVTYNAGSQSLGGGIFACPNDEGGQRSYGMNFWASSRVDPAVRFTGWQGGEPGNGKFWSSNSRGSAEMILLAETWSAYAGDRGYYANYTFGYQKSGTKPGQKFGGAGGIPGGIDAGRFGTKQPTEITYDRHRKRKEPVVPGKSSGRINLAYADGHVEIRDARDLFDAQTGKSTFKSLLSPADRQLEP